MWYYQRDRRFEGLKFRRQFSIGPYIADFCCYKKRLVIELDGGHHAKNRDYDKKRTAFLIEQGFRVLRFWNNDVLKKASMVLRTIYREIQDGD